MAVRVSKDDFDEKVLNAPLPVLVDFYSDSCVACKKLSPVLGDVEEEYHGRLTVVKLNTNYDTEIAEKYGVAANPTLLLFRKGEVIASRIGAAKPAELRDWIDSLL